jgi:MoaA/NifB/PqqE/SkfB family radical SAM enzyme
MWKTATSYLRHLFVRRPEGWHPMLAVYYLTYACEFRCPYCSDGSGTPYHALRSQVLRGNDLDRLLGRIRRFCDHLVVTGGEPTRHPDFAELLRMLPRHRFDSVVLTTIGQDLVPYLDDIARSIRYLVFSLDTMDAAKGDAWLGRGPGRHAEILATIEAARRHPGRRYEIVISSVATPDNLPDLYDVFRYAAERGFRHAVCPVLRGVVPDPALRGDPRYRELFDFLVAQKRRGFAVNGTVAYLRGMRDLERFRCRPSTMVAISPTGDVFYPCLEIGKVAGNLLEQPDLHALRAEGLRRHGPEPTCGNQCHSACALGFALLLDQPWTALSELGLMARAWLRRLLRRPLPLPAPSAEARDP